MKRHYLKTWPEQFNEVNTGKKCFEIRLNDRDFKCGDVLLLCEWDPETSKYTERECVRLVTYILHGPCFGLEKDYCIMSLKYF